jgi:hypothetical protein
MIGGLRAQKNGLSGSNIVPEIFDELPGGLLSITVDACKCCGKTAVVILVPWKPSGSVREPQPPFAE